MQSSFGGRRRTKERNPRCSRGLRFFETGSGARTRIEAAFFQFCAELSQEAAKSLHFNALGLPTDDCESQKCAYCGQIYGTSEQDSWVPYGHTDAELAQVILTWAKLTTEKKGQILAILRDGDQQARTGT